VEYYKARMKCILGKADEKKKGNGEERDLDQVLLRRKQQ
jgi:hypothetical protein